MTGCALVHYFSDALPPEFSACARDVLGGKGASLKEMTLAGLHVPPGFTIVTGCCEEFYAAGGRWPEGLEAEVRANLARLEEEAGRRLGRGARPLLVSVRSGAARSMPGMMDTLLNVGLTPSLADEVGDTPWFWRLYAEFVLSFARTVHGLDAGALCRGNSGVPADRAGVESAPQVNVCDSAGAEALLGAYRESTGRAFPTDPWDVLVQSIDAVFASWENERAVAYRKRNDVRGLKGTAVNVQMMFPSEVSGVVFTEDPSGAAPGTMVIEASYGLGEAVVSGDVTPDRFRVRREGMEIAERALGRKAAVVSAFGERRELDPEAASIQDARLLELARLALEVERHFGHPVDVEWGLADGRLALLQARAVRGLDVAREVGAARKDEVARLEAASRGGRRVWVAHNLGETLRFPTPLTWDVVRRFMSGDGGFGRMYRAFGYRPSRRVSTEGFLDLIGGRIYADPERLAELFWEAMPLRYSLDDLVKDKSALDAAPARFDPARADGRFLLKLPGNLLAMWRASRAVKRGRERSAEELERAVLPPFLEYVKAKRAEDLAKLTDCEVAGELRARMRRVMDDFGPESVKPGFFGGGALAALEATLSSLMGPEEGAALAGLLTSGLDDDVTFEQDSLLHRAARGAASLDDFVERFGHRCVGEMELAEPRWREDRSYLDQTVARLKSSPGVGPDEIHARNVARREEAERALPATLAGWGGSSFREDVERDLRDARRLLPYREKGKFYLMMGYELLRLAAEELARRHDLGRDVYFLRMDELAGFADDRARLTDEIGRRKLRHRALQRLYVPEVVDSGDLARFGMAPEPGGAGADLEGVAVAPGVATGPARIVFDPREAGDLGTAYVLVCPSTDPGWTPLFLNAAALVIERGGVLSHGAIVARDFGIPAVVLPDATRALQPGTRVRVDGNAGRVSLPDGPDGRS